MKKSFLVLLFALILFSTFQGKADCLKNEETQLYAQEEWVYTTGYHSDGTKVSVRYNSSSVQVYYNGNWYTTSIYKDYNNNRSYVKTPANKRYYI